MTGHDARAPEPPFDAAAYDELPDGVIVADASGRVVGLNPAATRITGLPAREVVGKPLADALPLEDFEGRRWWVLTAPYDGLATRTRQPERGLLLPGGREVLVTAGYVRESGPGTPVTRLVVCLRDALARERQQRASADLVTTVAHELRSPLTSVKGWTATLLAKWERFTDEQKRLMLETVNADADRVTRLITDLLDIARIDSGRLEIRRAVVDLGALVRRHVAALAARGEPADRFRVEVHPGLPELWADEDKIDQVVDNLLENAVRHGGGTVTVRLEPSAELGCDGIAVTVSDEGPGIPPEARGRIFTKFWKGRRGGSGLGLYIVRGIVEAHGGSVLLARTTRGATFRFVLPSAMPDYAV